MMAAAVTIGSVVTAKKSFEQTHRLHPCIAEGVATLPPADG
jgi:hypothetical protein